MTDTALRDGFRQLNSHAVECFATDDEHGIAFVVYEGSENRSLGGHRAKGSTQWHRFACNDPRCLAKLLVRWDVLAGFINQQPDYDPYERKPAPVCTDDSHHFTSPTRCVCGYFPNVVHLQEAAS